MNRRSLLLGSVVASVAGILGVKAQAAEPEPVLTLKDLQDAAALLKPDVVRSQRDLRKLQADFDIILDGKGYKLGASGSGYAVRIASGDYPAWWTEGKDRIITEKYPQANGWEAVSPWDLIRVKAYTYNYRPDMSLPLEDDDDTDS